MKNLRNRTLTLPSTALFAAIALTAGCDVDKTQAGELPDVDVDVESGSLPSYDVDWADVDVSTTTETVTVPKLKVVMEEESVEVPSIDVDLPGDDEKVRRTIQVSAQVASDSADLEINEVYQLDDTLLVISRLTGATEGDSKQMVTDQIVINAPELDVRHVIISDRPDAPHNEQFRYVPNRSSIQRDLDRSNKIYSRS